MTGAAEQIEAAAAAFQQIGKAAAEQIGEVAEALPRRVGEVAAYYYWVEDDLENSNGAEVAHPHPPPSGGGVDPS